MSDIIENAVYTGMPGRSELNKMLKELMNKEFLAMPSREEIILAVCYFTDIMCRCCEHTPENLPEAIADYLTAKNVIKADKRAEALVYITEYTAAAHRMLDELYNEVYEIFLYGTLSRVFFEINEELSILPDDCVKREKLTPENFFSIYTRDFSDHQAHIAPPNAVESFCEKVNLTGAPPVNVAMAVFDAVIDYQLTDYPLFLKLPLIDPDLHRAAELSDLCPPTPQALADFHGSITGSDNAQGLEEICAAAKELVYTLRKDNAIGGSVFNKLYHMFGLYE